MENNSVLTAYHCLASESEIYEDIKLKQFSPPILSLKLLPFPSMVLILDTKTAGHSLRSLLASVFQNTIECHFFRETKTQMFSSCSDSVIKITLICQCYFALPGLSGHSTDLVHQIIK